ncbi:hypothetical protein AnaeK_3346 [Anaeromyxobacter sp. K]|nr:hypothetical protein AnaeK_3346 [Anaeromyxobacter sp. K]
MHGNYEQAAKGARRKDVRDYFKSGEYSGYRRDGTTIRTVWG